MFSRVWRISQIYNMLGLEYTKVVNMTRLHRFSVRCTLKIHSVLNVLSYAKVLNLSGVQVCYSEKGFWIKFFIVCIWQGSKYTTVSKYAKVLNILGFWICRGSLKKRYIIHAWQDSEYSSVSENGRVLNMPGLHKVPNETFHYRYLIGFWIRLYFLNARVTESWGFCVNCILEIHGILNMH